jgi:hypothetical protein
MDGVEDAGFVRGWLVYMEAWDPALEVEGNGTATRLCKRVEMARWG